MIALLTRQQQRRLKRLCDEVDRLIETDRRFLERWPERGYRVRRAFAAESKINALVDGLDSPPLLPGGWARFVAVRQFVPGARGRLFADARTDRETDASEEEARAVYERLRNACPPGAAIDRAHERVSRERGQP